MKWSRSIFLIFSLHNIANLPCNATILVKFPKVVRHYLKYKAEAPDRPDPFDDFEVNSRRLLCDAVINAKQFRIMYYPSEYIRRRRPPQELIPQAFVTGSTTNYQNVMRYFLAEEELKFENRLVKQPGICEEMKTIQCAESPTVEWFVTYGFVERSFYLLELLHRTMTEKEATLQMTGLLEPSAVINNRAPDYFERQFHTSRDSMESICRFTISDVLRLCSAIFDALATEGSLRDVIKRMNYFRAERFWCLKRNLQVNGVLRKVNALRCRIIDEGKETTLFYALADTRERGAVFVFFETEITDLLELRVRVTKIGALLNPVGVREVPLRGETDEDTSTSTDEEERGQPVDAFEMGDTIDAVTDERGERKLRKVADLYPSTSRLSSKEVSTKYH